MKQSSKKLRGQFTLALYPEPSLQLDESTKEEVLNVLADLMREALGVEAIANPCGKEKDNECQNNA